MYDWCVKHRGNPRIFNDFYKAVLFSREFPEAEIWHKLPSSGWELHSWPGIVSSTKQIKQEAKMNRETLV